MSKIPHSGEPPMGWYDAPYQDSQIPRCKSCDEKLPEHLSDDTFCSDCLPFHCATCEGEILRDGFCGATCEVHHVHLTEDDDCPVCDRVEMLNNLEHSLSGAKTRLDELEADLEPLMCFKSDCEADPIVAGLDLTSIYDAGNAINALLQAIDADRGRITAESKERAA